MSQRLIGPILLGVAGVAILLTLGIWQVQRLGWKQEILANIETRMLAEPAPILPNPVDANRDKYLSIKLSGVIGREEIHVLASRKHAGAGYRVISPFSIVETDGTKRRILLDRGFVPLGAKDEVRQETDIEVTGNLHWPDEIDKYTPDPDTDKQIWFARDVRTLAENLGTEPVLLIARSDTRDGIEPHPVGTTGIPNDHLNYAITWFSLAFVWFGMTLFLVWRIKRQNG